MSTYGILLPCDGSEPMPVSVGDHTDIQAKVGGFIDAVVAPFSPSMFEDDADLQGPDFEAVAYVNDEGIILDLPLNAMASIMFQRELYGPVVVVSATSPSGTSDGENYDIPEWFMDAVFQGGLFQVARTMKSVATIQASAVRLALRDGIISQEQFDQLIEWMSSGDKQYFDRIEIAVNICLMYAMEVANRLDEIDPVLTDEDIQKFWDEQNGGE